MAVDPAFTTNSFIYLYYTFNRSGVCVNRVSRFTLSSGNTAANETVLLDNIPSPAGNHNAGDLHFGKDDFLYVSVGDGGCDYAGNSGCAGENDAARDRHVLLGKILRITRDGGIPPTNPFQGSNSGRCNTTGQTTAGNWCQETFAWGLRNPFRMAFDPNAAGTRFFINDVGQYAWEEIDEGRSGADYGWNIREGDCPRGELDATLCVTQPPGLTPPIYDYSHQSGCSSITGGAFVPNGLWPAEYTGAYLFSDFVCGKIFTLKPAAGGGWTRAEFVTGLGSSSAVHLAFGPHGTAQALYYTTYAGGGQVRRITYASATNRAPTAAIAASPTAGPAPLAVSFNGGGSGDPDGDALTEYRWTFGDGATATTAGPTTSHTYGAVGAYTAELRVRDSRGAVSAPATVRIDAGNAAPVPRIVAPAADARFRVGQTITLQGDATDAQDGALPDSALTWTVTLHHDTHTHPFLPPTTGNNLTFTAPAPEDLAAAANSYLEIQLTATDRDGRSATVSRELLPRTYSVDFTSEPIGVPLTVNGTTVTAPATVTSWDGYALRLTAPPRPGYTFTGWTIDGAAAGNANPYTLTTSADHAVTARYALVPPPGLRYYPLPSPVRLLDTRAGEAACDKPAAPLTAGGTRVQPTMPACTGIPATARAVVGNATTVNTLPDATAGYLTLFPSDAPGRPLAAGVNYGPGAIVNNAFTVGLGGDDAFSIYAASRTHLVIDVTGYFAPPDTGGLYFHPLPSPVRLLDTRAGATAGCDRPGAPLAAGHARTQPVRFPGTPCAAIPAEARALVGNATAVNTLAGASAGYLTLYPSDAARPTAASVNYAPGAIVNTAFTAGLGDDGAFNIFAYSRTELVIDVTGYYSDQELDANGADLLYRGLPSPVRLLDTRAGEAACDRPAAPLPGGGTRDAPATGGCTSVPAEARAVVGNATAVNVLPGAGGGYTTLYPSDAPSRPTVASVNYPPGAIVNNAMAVGLGGDGAFTIYAGGATTHLVIDLAGYFAP